MEDMMPRKARAVPTTTTTDVAHDFEKEYGDTLKKIEVPGGGCFWRQYDGDPNSPTHGLWVHVSSKVAQGLLEGRIMFQQSKAGSDDDKKFYAHCLDVRQVSSILSAAGSLGLMMAKTSDFDARNDLRAVENGILDLSGDIPQLIPFKPEYMITKRLRARYDKEAKSDLWLKFLQEATCDEDGTPDGDLLNWLQRLWGYTLSGTVQEDIVALYHGRGNNGKSTVVKAMKVVFGDYAKMTDIRELAGSSRYYSPNNEALADLCGLLLAWCDETPKSGSWDPAKFKLLTGGTHRAMRKHQHAFEFESTCVIHVCGQTLPETRDLSHGFWRRMRVVPFRQDFTAVLDDTLRERLQQPAEAPGILNWLLDGWIKWKAHGTGMCDAVKEATEAYREMAAGQSPLGFLDQCCEVHDPTLTKDPALRILHADLFEVFKTWANTNGLPRWEVEMSKFQSSLQEAGYLYKRARYVPLGEDPQSYAGRSTDMPSAVVWHGIKLSSDRSAAEGTAQRWRPGM